VPLKPVPLQTLMPLEGLGNKNLRPRGRRGGGWGP